MTGLWNEGWRQGRVRAAQSSLLLVTNLCPGISDVAGVLALLVFSFSVQPVPTAGLVGANFPLRANPVRGAHRVEAQCRGYGRSLSHWENNVVLNIMKYSQLISKTRPEYCLRPLMIKVRSCNITEANWLLAAQGSKVPGPVLHAGHDVRLLGGLSSQTESLVLAAEQES